MVQANQMLPQPLLICCGVLNTENNAPYRGHWALAGSLIPLFGPDEQTRLPRVHQQSSFYKDTLSGEHDSYL